VPCLCLLQYLFGWGTILWTNSFPLLLGWHGMFLVNSASHLWGRQPYDTGTLRQLCHTCPRNMHVLL